MKQRIIRICQKLGILPQRKLYVDHLDNYSPQLGRNIKVDVFLPTDFYSRSTTKYDILYINDGQDMLAVGMKRAVEKLWRSRYIGRLIVVAMYANERRLREYGTADRLDYKGRGDLADDYTRFVTLELIPFMRDHYQLKERIKRRVFAGFSLGGLSAFDIVWHHPDLFQKVGVFSGSFWWRSQPIEAHPDPDANRIVQDYLLEAEKREGLNFWFQTGTNDERADRNGNGIIDSIDDTQDVIDALEQLGYGDEDIAYVEVEGGEHNQRTWGQVLPQFLMWAFGQPSHSSPFSLGSLTASSQ
ncbi:MAG: alpha/beta hydrolase-fold protein [Bacteroidota bacterium]